MRKFKEVVRLHSLGLTQRQIARSCSIAQSTVHEYLKAAAEAGVSWPLPAEWNEQQLEGALSRKPRPGAKTRQAAQPDFPAIRRQLQTHRNLTLQRELSAGVRKSEAVALCHPIMPVGDGFGGRSVRINSRQL